MRFIPRSSKHAPRAVNKSIKTQKVAQLFQIKHYLKCDIARNIALDIYERPSNNSSLIQA